MRRLSERQRTLLSEISTLAPVTIADLASSVGETTSATRSAVRRLELRGLVEPATYQRTSAGWSPSDEGERLLAAVWGDA